jgi:hypothetical protein
MRRTGPLSLVLALCVVSPLQAAEISPRISINEAVRVVGELFPDICGVRGRLCAVVVDGRAKCPNELFIVFPAKDTPSQEPSVAWVALDARGKPIAIGSSKRVVCGKA